MQGRKFRVRTPENVVEEIKALIKNYGARGILFRDPIFTFDMERTTLIAEGIIKNSFDIQWVIETHPSHLNRELLKLMHRAGLKGVNIGIESSESNVLKACRRKDYPREGLFDLLSYCKDLRIKMGAFYIIGQISDTRESIKNTIKFAKRLNTDYAQFTICTPYPGTLFYDEIKSLIHSKKWDEFDGYTPVFNHPLLSSKELLDFKTKAMRSYYLRPKWLLSYIGVI